MAIEGDKRFFEVKRLGSNWGEEVKKWQKTGVFMGFLPVFGQFSGGLQRTLQRHLSGLAISIYSEFTLR